MTDVRSSSALFKRAEQLKRWEESDTNKQSSMPKRASRIQFSSEIVFLAACTAGDKDEVLRLLKMGADINTANVDGLTALHQACIDDNLEMVEFLVEHEADVNRGDNEGWTPLHATASCGFLSIARYLIDNGADVAAVNYDGELPLDIADTAKMKDLLEKVIIENGINCHKSRHAEVDALTRDAENWAKNGYVEVRDPKTGGTPLHVAAAKGYYDVAKILLEKCNVEPNCVDYEDWTPLHAAALWGQKDAAELLLKHGADPNLKNYSGQTCLDLVDPSISAWFAKASLEAPRRINNNNNNNNNKRKRSPPRHDVKRVELEITGNTDNVINDKPASAPEIIPKVSDGKPPKGRAPSPESAEPVADNEAMDEAPSWRRSASFRNRQQDNGRDNKPTNNNVDSDTILRRTHSFENDKTFYQRYRDVTARIKASSCPSIPPVPQSTLASIELRKKQSLEATNNAADTTNEDVPTRTNADRREREVNTWSSPATTSPTAASTTTTQTIRSSAESVESNSSNSTPSSATPTKLSPGNIFKNFFKSFVPPVRDEESETQRKVHAKRVRETRRSTQGVTLDELKSAEQLVKKKAGNGTTEASSPTKANVNSIADSFELEDAEQSSPRTTAPPAAEATVLLRRPPSASTANTTAAAPAITNTHVTSLPNDEIRPSEEEKERESSAESKSSSSPSSTQAALNVIQRRRRPKRRSTGVGHVDMDDIVNDRGGGGEGDGDSENVQNILEDISRYLKRYKRKRSFLIATSGTERTEDGEEKDYKALYEASQSEVRRLRSLLTTSEQQLRNARATIARLSQVNQNSLSEIEKREKRAMERKLSEMEEELKQLQKLKAENERLRAENRALTRVVSKLTNSAAK
ncbi:protein phosphatase 1 regulatory subunit 12A isoform X2 [Bicyclus anynana]|uniref:Protein phosphatase 1 regulatory subunit 12A isoform X2 n=1 Tax=Bicyclus anynana TaxID=110368 RepID=A0ABM3M4K9_BICAN|nr:protein phosphatase 1 regulatory subunit 12A isoform X2 [Bicyclus anynana]